MFYVQNILIYMNNGERWGCTFSTVHLLFIIQINGKSTRAWPIIKSTSTSFWVKQFFLGSIIKKLQRGPLNFNERHRCNWAKKIRVAPCDTPTLCIQYPCLWGRRGLVLEIFTFFLFHSFPNIYLFILQIYTPPPVFIIELWDKLHSIQE